MVPGLVTKACTFWQFKNTIIKIQKNIKEAIKVYLWKISSVATCLLKQEIGQFPWRLAWYTILVGWCRPLSSVTEKAFSLSTCFHFSISELMEELEFSLFTLKMMYFYKNFNLSMSKQFYIIIMFQANLIFYDDNDNRIMMIMIIRIIMIIMIFS